MFLGLACGFYIASLLDRTFSMLGELLAYDVVRFKSILVYRRLSIR